MYVHIYTVYINAGLSDTGMKRTNEAGTSLIAD